MQSVCFQVKLNHNYLTNMGVWKILKSYLTKNRRMESVNEIC